VARTAYLQANERLGSTQNKCNEPPANKQWQRSRGAQEKFSSILPLKHAALADGHHVHIIEPVPFSHKNTASAATAQRSTHALEDWNHCMPIC
jgi:hypothetical protein